MRAVLKLLVPAAALVLPGVVIAQQDTSDEVIEEIVTTGSRNAAKPRTASDSTVPIDVINDEDFNSLGSTADLTDNLRAMVPSYTAAPATGDGSAFVRPTSLRGTAPDQTLVLVNGKRRHRSALVQFFAPAAGNGAHGVDVGMIPGIALKRVERRPGVALAKGRALRVALAVGIVFVEAGEALAGLVILVAILVAGIQFNGQRCLEARYQEQESSGFGGAVAASHACLFADG